jgi:arginase family enzyme
MGTGALLESVTPDIIDYGDLHIYPSNPLKQMESMAAELFRIGLDSRQLLILGGEHTLSFGGYCGTAAACREKGIIRLGYVQIDNHFDFGKESVLHGPIYHGGNGRRISEHPDMNMNAIGFVGQGDLTSAAQFDYLVSQGVTIRGMDRVRAHGFEHCLREVLDKVMENADRLYVSLDIDVCDTATAPGTGHVTIGGITSAEFMQIATVLRDYPVAAFDIMEVSPMFDAGAATSFLAARLLYEWLFLKEIET